MIIALALDVFCPAPHYQIDNYQDYDNNNYCF